MAAIMSPSAQIRPEPYEVLGALARNLGLHEDWLRENVENGRIPAVLVGSGDQKMLRARTSVVQAAVDAIAESEAESRRRSAAQKTRRAKESRATKTAEQVESNVEKTASGSKTTPF